MVDWKCSMMKSVWMRFLANTNTFQLFYDIFQLIGTIQRIGVRKLKSRENIYPCCGKLVTMFVIFFCFVRFLFNFLVVWRYFICSKTNSRQQRNNCFGMFRFISPRHWSRSISSLFYVKRLYKSKSQSKSIIFDIFHV